MCSVFSFSLLYGPSPRSGGLTIGFHCWSRFGHEIQNFSPRQASILAAERRSKANCFHLIRISTLMALSVPGMGSVIATVSGYHGSDRFNLIKLISASGASYVGALTRSTTHLVCWKFEGKKYELAKEFGTVIIVNHRWLEDCLKERKRVPEYAYTLVCGDELGPLSMQPPASVEKVRFFKKKRNDFTQKLDDYEHAEASSSLKHSESSSSSHTREKMKTGWRGESSVQSSTCLMRKNRKIFNDIGNTSSTRPSHKSRRLVKNTDRSNLEGLLFDSDQECYSVGLRNKKTNTGSSSKCTDSKREDNVVLNNESSSDSALDTIGGKRESNHASNSKDSNSGYEDGLAPLERPHGERLKDMDQFEPTSTLPASPQPSCAICLTEFSPTRGVLSCGHRFCYSCIEKWADLTVSRRKIATCPMCKASFESIRRVEDAGTSDQNIYSQTIPCSPSAVDVYIFPDQERCRYSAQASIASACTKCRSREPADMLIRCHICVIRCIHSYCLDPPEPQWTCTLCKDLLTLYINTTR